MSKSEKADFCEKFFDLTIGHPVKFYKCTNSLDVFKCGKFIFKLDDNKHIFTEITDDISASTYTFDSPIVCEVIDFKKYATDPTVMGKSNAYAMSFNMRNIEYYYVFQTSQTQLPVFSIIKERGILTIQNEDFEKDDHDTKIAFYKALME